MLWNWACHEVRIRTYNRTHRYISTHDLFLFPFTFTSFNIFTSLMHKITFFTTYICQILMSMHRTAKRFLRVRTALLVQYELGHFPDVYTELQKHRMTEFLASYWRFWVKVTVRGSANPALVFRGFC